MRHGSTSMCQGQDTVESQRISFELKQNDGTNNKKIGQNIIGTHAKRKLQGFPLDEDSSAALPEKKCKRGCEQLQGEMRKTKPPVFDGLKNAKHKCGYQT